MTVSASLTSECPIRCTHERWHLFDPRSQLLITPLNLECGQDANLDDDFTINS